VREFARSALEGAGVGFAVFRAVRREGGTDWQPLDATAGAVTREQIGPILEAALTSGERVETDHEVRVASGGPFWRRVIAVPVDDDVVATMTYDIGELVGARGRAAALSQDSSDVVAITSPDSGLSWVSPSVEATLGYRAEEMIGHCAVDLVHPEDVECVVERFLAVADDASDAPTVELRLRRSDGR